TVRLLSGRPTHVGRVVIEEESETHRCRYRFRHAGQHLPLRDLWTHPQGDQDRRRSKRMTNNIALVNRRGFLGTMFSAGAFVLSAKLLPAAELNADAAAWHPSVYLGIEPDGSVIVVAHRSEMGTGIRTALPTVVADELEADWSRVK